MKTEKKLSTIFDRLDFNEKEKFKNLKDLDVLTFEDVDLLSDDEDIATLLVETSDSERIYKHDMAIAKIFVKKHIRGDEYYQAKDASKAFVGAVNNFFNHGGSKCTYHAYDKLNEDMNEMNEKKRKEEELHPPPKETVLNYKGELVCQLLKGFSKNKLTVADLFSDILLKLRENKDFYEYIETIDFSENQLLDSDSIMIKETILLLTKNIKNNLTINLTGNHFYGFEEKYKKMVDPSLFEILRLENVSTVVLCGNEIYTKEQRHDFFIKAYREELLHKLIFCVTFPTESQLRKICDEDSFVNVCSFFQDF